MDSVRHARLQATACAALGSPMYADLIGRIADDIEEGGPAAALVARWRDSPAGDAIALRLVGAVHRLVLAGVAPELAPFYPSVGGTWSPCSWPVVREVLTRHAAAIAELMALPPQTNEVGRSAGLMAGLLTSVRGDESVRLFEIGASAGLNLLADQFAYRDTAGALYGDVNSPVVIESAWDPRDDLPSSVTIAERAGCDIAPIPLSSEDDERALLSYVWPDMTQRWERARAAIDLARRNPPAVRAQHAAEFVATLVPQPGTLTVLWHSVMWQYVAPDEQSRIERSLAELAAAATPDAPCAHIRCEPVVIDPDAGTQFLLIAERWDGGDTSTVVADVAPHGPPVRWRAR